MTLSYINNKYKKCLKPCPICGDEVSFDYGCFGNNTNAVRIVCECGLNTRDFPSNLERSAIEDAIDYWNERDV